MTPIVVFLSIIFASILFSILMMDGDETPTTPDNLPVQKTSIQPNALPHTNTSLMIVDGQMNTSQAARIDSHGNFVLPGQFSGTGFNR